MPVALEPDTMLSATAPQCDGIWRPPELGSSFDADGREQHVERRDAELQAQRAIAVVREEPVVARPEDHAGGDEDGLVAGAADLEERLALVLELDFLVVDLPREEHAAVGPQQVGVAWIRAARLGLTHGRRRRRCRLAVYDGGGLHAIRIIHPARMVVLAR